MKKVVTKNKRKLLTLNKRQNCLEKGDDNNDDDGKYRNKNFHSS